MADVDVSHREIYDRLLLVEQKIEHIDKNTQSVVEAFNAASGAFKFLDMLGRVAKPILWVGGLIAAVGVMWSNWKGH